ncbi:cell division protein FtsX [Lentibacter sp. XHP0401]|uniref:cell division protein FtsX n=1 Tax=Lentibacter sp. XHP0401 TaxID=2984334 RepID=UPI0021E74D04|nr:FtsX-like permease family protein [Lentibacter sp. XHP0401]MCV2894114.1 cell division protein FtsX [Lentibacter sp. XHP0401]
MRDLFDINRITGFIIGDAQAERAVPPTGFTARLTVFAAAVMAFLAVFALALSVSAGRLSERWANELAQSATVRISAPAGQMQAQTEAALAVLETTPGIASARVLSDGEQRKLLEPWFGPDMPLDALPIPQLIEIVEADVGLDAEALRLRLLGEVPGAVLDDHSRWRKPLAAAAGRLSFLGWFSIVLIFAVMGAMITLAANAALAANAKVITVMRLVGAKDSYIASAFVRRFTLRSLTGAAVGMVLGVIAVVLMPAGGGEAGFLSDLGFQGASWLWPLVIPLLAGGVAFGATQAAARRTLKELR